MILFFFLAFFWTEGSSNTFFVFLDRGYQSVDKCGRESSRRRVGSFRPQFIFWDPLFRGQSFLGSEVNKGGASRN